MKYIRVINTDGTTDNIFRSDYNTGWFSTKELKAICQEWEEEDGDGTKYVLVEEDD